MCQALVRPHLDYGDIIYDEACNKTFHQKLESIQHNACLVLSGAIRGSSRGKNLPWVRFRIPLTSKLVQEFCLFYKIFKENKDFSFQSNTNKRFNDNTTNIDKMTLFYIKHYFFKTSFLPSTVTEWKKLDPNF